MRIKLRIQPPGVDAYPWAFEGSEFRIGRDPACELKFTDQQAPTISWEHAKFELADGRAFITDLGSSNGTYLNDNRLSEKRSLAVGDRVALGQEGPVLTVVELSGAKLEHTAKERSKKGPLGYIGNERDLQSDGSDGDSIKAAIQHKAKHEKPWSRVRAASDRSPSGEVSNEPNSPVEGGSTRSLFIDFQKRHRRLVKFVGIALGVVLPLLTFVFFLHPGYLRPGYEREAFRRMISQVERSVVHVATPKGDGSGFFIDSRGTIATAHHVMEGNTEAEIVLRDGARLPVEGFIGASVGKDLVLLRVKAQGELPPPLALKTELPEITSTVFALGSPLGYQWTVSEGIVSATRTGEYVAQRMEITANVEGVDVNINQYRDYWRRDDDAIWIQTDCSVIEGNSGGPLVDRRGAVVGINSFGADATLNFAISAKNIQELVEASSDVVRQLSDLPTRPTETR